MEIIKFNGKEIYLHPVFSDYGCDRDGHVYSMKRGLPRRIHTTHRTRNNGRGDKYMCLWVYQNGRRQFFYKHRFNCECFMGHKIIPNCVVHHKDRNPENNSKSNLLMLDQEQHKILHGKRGY